MTGCTLDLSMRRPWTLTAATIALLGMLFIPLLLSIPTLASATLTNAPRTTLHRGLILLQCLA